MEVLTHAATYTAAVFGTGFCFGTCRVLCVVPMVGQRYAELMEMPLMIGASFFWSKRINSSWPSTNKRVVGIVSLGCLLACEIALGKAFSQGEKSLLDILWYDKDAVSGPAYYLALLAFAAFPSYHKNTKLE